ncbi:MAG: SctK family type III secretion system sorting platform protein [Deltaproteobacteria bacterium]|jgi:hypothetical protein|nr:SctK family type III secretion system sorting platform protein [Deltaproteobacteria bacterium]
MHETMRSNPKLFARILRFNLPASRSFMPENLTKQATVLQHSGLLEALEKSPRSAALVRRYLFKNCLPACKKTVEPEHIDDKPGNGVCKNTTEFFVDFQEERRRLALLAPKQLHDLALLFGAGIYALKIAETVKRDEVLALRSFLGPYYTYALLRGRFQLGQVRAIFQRPASNHTEDSKLPLTGRIAAAGVEALQICLSDWPQSLQKKVRPFLPPHLQALAETALAGWPEHIEKNPENLKTVWVSLKKILLQELAPECQPCFA